MSQNTYELFTRVRISGNFTRQDQSATIDPTEVLLYVEQPDHVIVTYRYANGAGAIVRDDQGLYHYDAELSMAGRWVYKWEGSGTVECGSKDTNIWVNHSHFVGSRWPTGAGLVGLGVIDPDDVAISVEH